MLERKQEQRLGLVGSERRTVSALSGKYCSLRPGGRLRVCWRAWMVVAGALGRGIGRCKPRPVLGAVTREATVPVLSRTVES